MDRTNKQLWADLHRLRGAISKKFKAFKEGNLETQIQLTKQYKPLLKQLKKNNDKYSPPLSHFKKEEPMDVIKEEEDEDEGEQGDETKLESTSSDGESQEVDDGEVDKDSSLNTVMKQTYNDPLVQKYMTSLFKSNRFTDHVFGPRFDGDRLMIGDGELEFKSDGSLIIKNKTYGNPTEGLLELIFKINPQKFSTKDVNVYKSILESTNAHKKGYNKANPINSSRSKKYTGIISPIFAGIKLPLTPKYGKGLYTKRLGNSMLQYWDDPNELIDRLKLLEASRLAGNTGVKNEIFSIVEELREAGYIIGRGNTAFRSLVR